MIGVPLHVCIYMEDKCTPAVAANATCRRHWINGMLICRATMPGGSSSNDSILTAI